MSTITTDFVHHALCNEHLAGDDVLNPADKGMCVHELPTIDGAIVSVMLTGTPGVEVYSDDRARTATAARRLAYAISQAAEIVDRLALPAGGKACHVEHVALLAGVSEHTVRDAINRGDLPAHKAVDGTARLVLSWDDAMDWARQQRSA